MSYLIIDPLLDVFLLSIAEAVFYVLKVLIGNCLKIDFTGNAME